MTMKGIFLHISVLFFLILKKGYTQMSLDFFNKVNILYNGSFTLARFVRENACDIMT
jgi:hypothetical protein